MTERTKDAITRAICMETCAFKGEPACFTLPGDWPNPDCDEPGCAALADAVLALKLRALLDADAAHEANND